MHFFKGNTDAIKLCMDLIYISHLWDDMVDKDKDRTDYEINDGFRIALVEIGANPFYLRYANQLHPLMMKSCLDYEALLPLERGTGHDKTIAFTLRNSVLGILAYSIFLIGGMDWYRQVAPEFYRTMWDKLEEQFQFFMKE